MSLVTVQRSPDSPTSTPTLTSTSNTNPTSNIAIESNKLRKNDELNISENKQLVNNTAINNNDNSKELRTNFKSNNYVKINKFSSIFGGGTNKFDERTNAALTTINMKPNIENSEIISSSNFNELKAIYSNFQNEINKQQHHHQNQSFRKSAPTSTQSTPSNTLISSNKDLIKRLSLNLLETTSNKSDESLMKSTHSLKPNASEFSLRSKENSSTTKNKSKDDDVLLSSENNLINSSQDDLADMSKRKSNIRYFSLKFKNNNKNDQNVNTNKKNSQFNSSNSLNSKILLTSSCNSGRNLIEKYFVVKDAALILPRRSNSSLFLNNNYYENNRQLSSESSNVKSCNNDYNLITHDNNNSADLENYPNSINSTGDILIHLQSMISILRPNDTIILAVKLASYQQDRIRYLVILETKSTYANNGINNNNSKNSTNNLETCEESAILGLDIQDVSLQSQNHKNNHLSTTTISSSSDKNENTNQNNHPQIACTVGLILPIYANCEISLDGDGGFKFKSHQSTHIFKPVSIQAMWSAYQYLHKTFENARKNNYYSISSSSSSNNNNSTNNLNSINDSLNSSIYISSNLSENNFNNNLYSNHEWIKYYSSLIPKNNIQTINEWYQKEERSAQREDFTTPYFDCLQLCKEQEEIGLKIKEKLREIMMSSKDDYGSMSSIHIREMLEKELQLKLDSFKKFIDATIFQFYNQLVECASQIMPYMYLGTEWNASNYDSLVNNRITHILNVSSEVDNFFPDTFKYLNIRVLDNEKTDLLKEFDRTNKFIQEAKEQGTSCLVHCKMGVSRSASVVIAFLMKDLNWSYEESFNYTKQKRSCINPNDSFREQLITYESILNAHRAKYNLFEPSPSPQSLTNSLIQFFV